MHPVITAHQTEVQALCAQHGVRRLSLFGSATKGTFDPANSDLDFLVEFHREGEGWEGAFDQYFGLLEGLEALFGRKIDLVEAEAITSKYFRASVEATKQVIYEG